MGTINKGILGGFSGKVGPVVGANWRGKDVMRSKPKKSNRVATQVQLEQRAKFALMTKFLRPLNSKLKLYFGQPSEDKSRINLATSYHLTDAVAGLYPNYSVDYDKVIITRGELLGLQEPDTVAQANAVVVVTWTDNSGQGQAKASDVLLAVFYNENQKLFDMQQFTLRSAGTSTIQLPETWSGDTAHCWISVAASDDKLVANSQYMGALSVL